MIFALPGKSCHLTTFPCKANLAAKQKGRGLAVSVLLPAKAACPLWVGRPFPTGGFLIAKLLYGQG
jgi:hypothetical protein